MKAIKKIPKSIKISAKLKGNDYFVILEEVPILTKIDPGEIELILLRLVIEESPGISPSDNIHHLVDMEPLLRIEGSESNSKPRESIVEREGNQHTRSQFERIRPAKPSMRSRRGLARCRT